MRIGWALLLACGCGPVVGGSMESDGDSGSGGATDRGGSASDSSGPGGSTGTARVCGNGVVDPGEACDNEEPSSICNEYCQTPGTLLMETTLDGCGGHAVLGDPYGDVFVLERGCINGTNVAATRLTKVDATAAVVWSEQWTDPGTRYASGQALDVDASGNAVYAGRAYTGEEGQWDVGYAFARKHDPNGTLVWMDQDFDNQGFDKAAYGVDTDPLGNVFVASTRGDSALIRKLGQNGQVLWGLGQSLDGGLGHTANVAAGPDANAVLTFNRDVDGDWITVLVAYDAEGAISWETAINYSPAGRDLPRAIRIGGDGSVYVIGDFESADTFRNTALVTKLSPGGDLLWTWELVEPSGGRDIAVDSQGNAFVTIGVDADPETEHLEIVRLSGAGGEVEWSSTAAPPPGGINHWGIGLDAKENVWVTGTTEDFETWVGQFAR